MAIRVHLEKVNTREWLYLRARFGPKEAALRREHLEVMLERFKRKGKDLIKIHEAVQMGITVYEQHGRTQMSRAQAKTWNAGVARAQRDLRRALTSLRRLLPEGAVHLDDDQLFELRDMLLQPTTLSPSSRPRGGRPWDWKSETEAMLKRRGVIASERKELISALGFAE